MLNQQFGNYKFLSILGEGGMAIVYLAENVMLNSHRAIKVLKPEFINNLSVRKRFLGEGKKLSKIENQHVIKVYDVIEKKDFVAIVMEYVEGQTLKQYIEKKTKKKNTEIYNLLEQILIALSAVHDAGYIHRDIKPSNIMLSQAGQIKLTDFGIAKDLNDFSETITNTQMGTPLYMSPEQIRSSKHIDNRSDIFSLGVVLFELTTSKFPFDKNLSLPEIQYKILNKSIPESKTIWDKYIKKATSKKEEHRYISCNDWLVDLRKNKLLVSKRTKNKFDTILIYISIVIVILIGCAYLILIVKRFLPTKRRGDQTQTTKLQIDSSLVKDKKYLKIGSQIWGTGNLDVTTFANGDLIPEIKSPEKWCESGKNKQPAWCYYEFDSTIGAKYGKLYNWYAVSDPRGLAPNGWHIPDKNEIDALLESLGGMPLASTRMKAQTGWLNRGNGTNDSGFFGLPGGYCGFLGNPDSLGYHGYWWSSTEYNYSSAYFLNLNFQNVNYNERANNKVSGFSVRCIKDK
jgi:uncharacterized protein (TIGR02145 family)